MKAFRKPRCDSFEAHLSPEELEELHALLMQPALSIFEMRERAPVWSSGKFDGKKPNWRTLLQIRTRLRREEFLTTVEANARVSEAALKEIHRRYKGRGDIQQRMLNHCMTLMTDEVLGKTLDQLDPQGRTAAARVLLQHSAQKIMRKKLAVEKKKIAQTQEKSGAVTKDALDRAAEELKLL